MSFSLQRTTFLTSGALLLRIITQAGMLTFAAHYLGPAAYGEIAAATSVAVMLSIVPNLGAGLVVIAKSGGDPAIVADTWRYAWPQHLILGFALFAFYSISGATFWQPEIPYASLLAIAASEIIAMPLILQISSMLQAIEKVPLSQVIHWCVLLLRVTALGGCLSIYKAGGSINAYAGFQLGATLLGLAGALTAASRYLPLAGRPRLPRLDELKSGLVYCATSGVGAASMEIDKVMAMHAAAASEAGIYATMSRVVSAGTTPIIGLLMAAQPRLFFNGRVGGPEMLKLVRNVGVGATVLGVGAGTCLFLCEPLLQLLFGERFRALGELVPVMSVAVPMMSLRFAGTNIMLTLGHPALRIAIDLAGIAFLATSMMLLGQRYGLLGLGMALVISEACLAAASWITVFRELRRKTDITYQR